MNTAPKSGAKHQVFEATIPQNALEVVPGCVYLLRGWMPKRLADAISERIVEETYEYAEPQYIIGRSPPARDPRNKATRFGAENLPFTYGGRNQKLVPWTSTLRELGDSVSDDIGVPFNCGSVRYLAESSGVGPHSEAVMTPHLGETPTIVTLVLGNPRKVEFRPTSDPGRLAFEADIRHGDVLVMVNRSQLDWLHSFPPARTSGSTLLITF